MNLKKTCISLVVKHRLKLEFVFCIWVLTIYTVWSNYTNTGRRQCAKVAAMNINSVRGEFFSKNMATGGFIPKNLSLQLFITFSPVVKGSEKEFYSMFLRSLTFFWPATRTNLVIVSDAEIPNRDQYEKQWLTRTMHFNNSYVRFNSPSAAGGKKGWFRQQWVMFWGDNFTSADYVGFVDTDTVFITPPLPGDMFQPTTNKPVIIAVYKSCKTQDPHYQKWWAAQTQWILKKPGILCCMSYFPFIIKVKHIALMREHISRLHKKDFAQVFIELRREVFSQFNILCNYLWYYQKDSYSWHVEVPEKDWNSSLKLKRSYNSFGISESMMEPKPRISDHFTYMWPKKSIDFMLYEGYCFFVRSSRTHAHFRCTLSNLNEYQRGLFYFEKQNWTWHPNTYTVYKRRFAQVE